MSNPGTPKVRRARNDLSIGEKIAILTKIKNDFPFRNKYELSRIFGLTRTTMARMVDGREKLEMDWEKLNKIGETSLKRIVEGKHPDVEIALEKWYNIVTERGLKVDELMLMEKANCYAHKLGHRNFKATGLWLTRWKAKFGIVVGRNLDPGLFKPRTRGRKKKTSASTKYKDYICDDESDENLQICEEEIQKTPEKVAENNVTDLPQLLCIIVEEESDIAAFKDYVDPGEAVKTIVQEVEVTTQPSSLSQSPSPASSTASSISPAFIPTPNERIFASPLAKKLASAKGLDIATLQGSGPAGRIRAQDVDAMNVKEISIPQPSTATSVIASAVPEASFVDLPTSPLKQEIARQAVLSKQTIPHYYLTMDVIMDDALSLKDQLNSNLEESCGSELSMTDIFVKAAALACLKVPEVNSSWQDTYIRQYTNVDMNVIMNTGSNCSVSPVVHSADRKGLVSISNEVKKFTEMISNGSFPEEQIQVGTFTISSLGLYGVRNVINIVTPPQACSLGIGAILERLVVDENELGYKTAKIVNVTLSCDHRVVDGAVGAQWLQHFKKLLEKPQMMLL